MHALVIDDSRAIRLILGRILRGIGFDVDEAPNGREGLARLEAGMAPDLVLVDWNMPEMTGIELLRAINSRGIDVPLRSLGLPQAFLEHGSVGQVLADVGLTEQDVARRIAEWTAVLAERAEGVPADQVQDPAVEERR